MEDNMLFTAKDLIPGQDVQVLSLGTSISEALKLMVDKDFSQIPVVDSDGVYVGLLSEHGIADHLVRANHHRDALSEVIDRWYDDKVEAAQQDIDIDQILTRLKTQDAIVIVDTQHKPRGVVTHYDVAQKCGSYAYRFMLIEYIESTLRKYIEAVYPTAEARDKALTRSTGADSENKESTDRRPARYEDFTLSNYIESMKSQWREFRQYLGPLALFTSKLDKISDIRNIVMHFKHEKWNADLLRELEETARYLWRCEPVARTRRNSPISMEMRAAVPTCLHCKCGACHR
jgi:predicted transcriptional regulator